jgi:glycogen operon protein
MLATVLLSQGTPMLLAGDEFGRTQQGNNNAYCQDNETSWIDWAQAMAPEGRALTAFTARLVTLRHQHSVLRCDHYLHGREEIAPGIRDIDWFDENAASLSPDAWNNPLAHLLTLRRAGRDNGSVTVLTCFFNSDAMDREFRIPGPLPVRLLIDSASPDAPESDLAGDHVVVKARSVLLVRAVIRAEGP